MLASAVLGPAFGWRDMACATNVRMARAYAERGIRVLPLHTPAAKGCSCGRNCGNAGKHPRTQHGFKEAGTDAATIERWWRMWPDANVGIATGAESGVVVLDVDDMIAVRYLEAIHGPLQETATVATSRGKHFYFAHPGGHIRTTIGEIRAKVDTRADGGYVVAPPSLHASGARYRWISRKGVGFAPCPEWIIQAVSKPATATARYEDVDDPIEDGQRNKTLFALGCAMRHHGAPEAAIAAALAITNEHRCAPPIEDVEITRLAASCMRYDPKKQTYLERQLRPRRTAWMRNLQTN